MWWYKENYCVSVGGLLVKCVFVVVVYNLGVVV